MAISHLGLVGWRGMVGSVLMERMQAERDFEGLQTRFYSTSQVSQDAPDIGANAPKLLDAYNVEDLSPCDVVISCQGGDYTKRVLPQLRASGWSGYWIDAASAKRMDDDSVIVLDPVNHQAIKDAIGAGTQNFIGGNCTVSLMLMGFAGLFRQGWVEWMSTMTYQAASGAGAKNMRELVEQMRAVGDGAAQALDSPSTSALDLDRTVSGVLRSSALPTQNFGVPLAGSLIAWIDRKMEGGETREEWKGHVESNKILGLHPQVPVDGICVRIGAMRCHSQAVTIKLRRDVPLDEIESVIQETSPWTSVVPNERDATAAQLSPVTVSGTLNVPVGRLRKLRMGSDFLGAMTVGDQLLWGAAEPLRRTLNIIREARD